MTFRDLPPEEWHRLEVMAEGRPFPSPDLARIVVAEEADTILGFVFVQLIPHIEPIWIAESQRGTQLWEPLLHHAISTMPSGTHFYAFNAHKGTEKIASTMGFTRHQWSVDEGVAP